MNKLYISIIVIVFVLIFILFGISGFGLFKSIQLSDAVANSGTGDLTNSVAALKNNMANVTTQLDGFNKQTGLFALKADVNTLQTDLSGKVLTVLKMTGDLNAAVNLLKSSPTTNQISVGTILTFCGDISIVTIPKGYLPCDGRACLKSQYPDLSRVIGSKFNKPDLKDQVLYFNVPDMRNVFMRGAQDDSERGLVSSWKTALPQKFKILVDGSGDHTHTTENAGGHTHKLGSTGGHAHSMKMGIGTDDHNFGSSDGVAATDVKTNFSYFTSSVGDHTHDVVTNGDHVHSVKSGGMHTHTLSGGDNETSPANVKVHFIIKSE